MPTKKYTDLISRFFQVIIIIVFFAGLSAQQTNDDLWVMSYNIRVAVDEGTNSWENRKAKVASMIRLCHADIVGLQEALKMQIEDLLQFLPEYGWYGAGRDDGKEKGEYSAILFRKDKFQLIKGSTFWLSETPDTVSIGWDAALPRIATWVLLKENKTGKMFYHFNTHFDHIGVEARKNSAELILRKIKEITADESPYSLMKAVVLTGDFNSNCGTDVYKIITEKLPDAMNVSENGHYGSNVSFNGFGKSIEEGNIIDFIFVNDKISVKQHGIIGETFEGTFPSDHMPVAAEIVLN